MRPALISAGNSRTAPMIDRRSSADGSFNEAGTDQLIGRKWQSPWASWWHREASIKLQ